MDMYFTEAGDIAVGHDGDVAMTQTPWRDDVQQAYIRIMTERGDYRLYPEMGAGLSDLYGMPQSPATGAYGERLITAALNREGRFVGKPFRVKSIPTSEHSIRFDVSIVSGSRREIELSVEQDLDVV